MQKPEAIDEQIKLDPKKYIVSKTDLNGILEYGNDYFVEISGYQESELIGQPHSIIRHPDMPKAVFKLIWDRLEIGQSLFALVKNLAKDGRYYWVLTEFEVRRNKLNDKPIGYTAYRKAPSEKAIKAIEPIYKKLLEIEKESGVEGGYKYLKGYLEEQNKSYDQFIDDIAGNSGIVKMFFKMMKKVFGG
jgi:PAS domain S-box-containing protein